MALGLPEWRSVDSVQGLGFQPMKMDPHVGVGSARKGDSRCSSPPPFWQCRRRSRLDCGLRVRWQHCKSGLPQLPCDLSVSSIRPHSAQITPFAAGLPRPHRASPPPSMRVFKRTPPLSTLIIPLPCLLAAFSTLLLTRLLSDSIPQATACLHLLPPWAALHPRRPLVSSSFPS